MLVALMVAGCADSTRPDALQHAQLGTDCKACEAALSQERMGSRTLARTMATDLCAASLKEAGEMRASVRELRHELQRTQKKLHAYKRAYERQSNSASVPNEERGSLLRLVEREAVNSQWMVRAVCAADAAAEEATARIIANTAQSRGLLEEPPQSPHPSPRPLFTSPKGDGGP
jgi:hypothetical protein